MNESTKQPIKMIPGDDRHLSMLMAPSNLNFFIGKDREDLLAYGRAAFEAGKAGQCLHQIQEPAPVLAEDTDTTSKEQYRRMLGAACHDLGLINEALDLDPNDGGADPILEAIAALKALADQAAPAAVAVPAKVIEALEMLENGALNVVENAKNRGDGYDEGYAKAMAKMARETLDALSATPAALEVPAEGDPASLLQLADLLESGRHLIHVERKEVANALRTVAATPAAAPVELPDCVLNEDNFDVLENTHGFTGDFEEMARIVESMTLDKVRALLATATGLPAQAVLDYPWRDRLLDGRELVRDQQGFAEHPELPLLDEGMKPRAFFAALGVEMKHTMADDDLSMDEYDAMSDAENWSAWMPRPPIGDAWNLVAIFDTEDGPAAWWARAQKESREAAAKEGAQG